MGLSGPIISLSHRHAVLQGATSDLQKAFGFWGFILQKSCNWAAECFSRKNDNSFCPRLSHEEALWHICPRQPQWVHNGSALDPLLTIFLITDSLPSFLEAFIGHGGYNLALFSCCLVALGGSCHDNLRFRWAGQKTKKPSVVAFLDPEWSNGSRMSQWPHFLH